MSYVVLARKWRPMRFEDLVGQDHVARTLENAIAQNRVAHAFLFTGVRGVGKTTSARILAKALNCMAQPGPTAKPCLQCPACLEITAGSDVDVREIDGASYTGVDDVRRLQDQIPYRPARDRFKIFIVDEVHMLSQNAWNAFLKTLEEPPPHVKFIFATTEVHKVPVTILSRVQRFDFKLIAARAIAERLRSVLAAEGVQADDGAIGIIAREASGSMRDAMSLLDQVIAFGADRLDGASVAQVLGVASRQVLHDVAAALVRGDPVRCLEIVAELAQQGFDMAHVARDLLALLRDLVVAKLSPDAKALLDAADDELADIVRLSADTDADDLLRLHQGFSQSFDDVVRSGQPRAGLEMLLVRLARRPALVPIDDLVARLSALERRLTGRSGPAAPDRKGPEGRGGFDPKVRPPATDVERRSEQAAPRPREPRSAAPPAAPSERREEPPARPIPAAAPSPVAAPSPPPAELGTDALDAWVAILESVRQSRPELAAMLEHAAPLTVGASELVVGWEPGSVFASQASNKEALALVTRAASEHFMARTRVVFEFDSAGAKDFDTLARRQLRERQERLRAAMTEARAHPRIAEAIEILGARLKDLKLGQE
jgi:DNA polymerase III subunit gamma/tau